MLPGEISSANSFTSIESAQIQSLKAGSTYLFAISLLDIYQNALQDGDNSSEIQILAEYESHSDWPSPI